MIEEEEREDFSKICATPEYIGKSEDALYLFSSGNFAGWKNEQGFGLLGSRMSFVEKLSYFYLFTDMKCSLEFRPFIINLIKKFLFTFWILFKVMY